MKSNKRMAGGLLALLAALLLLPGQALAAGRIDLERTCGLTISYQDGSTPLSGAAFSIYRAAEVDPYGELTAAEAFRGYGVRFDIRGENDAAWRAAASTLEGYVLRDELTPTDSGKTDSDGKLSFPTGEKALEPGLYLVLGARHRQGGRIYDAQPFLVLLPALDREANDWTYDMSVSPKHESRPEPSDPGGDTVTRKVLKVWEDEGCEEMRPRSVTVQLLRDGRVYDTVTLDAGNGWRHTWRNLDGAFRWSVVEEDPGDYTVEITREGITFVVVNAREPVTPPPTPTPVPVPTDEPAPPSPTPAVPDGPVPTPPPETPDGPELPQTGQLWWPVPALICGGLLLIVAGVLRRRRDGDET